MSAHFEPEAILRRHVYIETKYRPSGPHLLSDKLITITENTILNVTLYQEEEEFYPPDNEVDSWDNIPMSNVTYTMILKEVVNEIEGDFKGIKHVHFETNITNYSRYLIASIFLKDVLKEENLDYGNYEIEIDLVIMERSPHINASILVVNP